MRQMGGACSSAQLRNATLTSQLYEVHRSLLGLLPRLPPSAAAALRCAPRPPAIMVTLSSVTQPCPVESAPACQPPPGSQAAARVWRTRRGLCRRGRCLGGPGPAMISCDQWVVERLLNGDGSSGPHAGSKAAQTGSLPLRRTC